jgi:hypothetical protein
MVPLVVWSLLAKLVFAVPKWAWRPVVKLLGVAVAKDSVARELRVNARRIEEDGFITTPFLKLQTSEWDKYRERLHLLERVQPGLWHAVAAAYEHEPQGVGDAFVFEQLADRLENAL